MTVFLMVIHTLAAVLLMVVILMQSGRGGGLTEGFASAESIFGAKTNAFMVKATAVLASIFLFTSVGLAHLSAKKERSVIPEDLTVERLPDIEIPIDMPEDMALPESGDEAVMDDVDADMPVSADPAVEDAPAASDVSTDIPAAEPVSAENSGGSAN